MKPLERENLASQSNHGFSSRCCERLKTLGLALIPNPSLKFLLLFGLAISAHANEFSITIIPLSVNVAAIKSACANEAKITWEQPTAIEHARIGAHVMVKRMPDARFDGLYRITEFSRTRDRDAAYTVKFTAICVRQ